MSLDPLLPSLPKELAPILNKIAGKAVVVTATASNNIAQDNAVQVCGPVAGSIQYVFNLSLHYHAGEIDTCWRLIGGTGAVETSTSGCPSLPRTVQKLIESPTGDFKLKDNQSLSAQVSNTQRLHLHHPGIGTLPVLATFDPNVEGNWIAASVVKRFNFKYQQATIHKNVPTFKGQCFEKTRIFVDLTCGGKLERRQQCQHRFYVVNHCDAFDILLGTKLYP